jgi:hypothetical protein
VNCSAFPPYIAKAEHIAEKAEGYVGAAFYDYCGFEVKACGYAAVGY